MGYLIIFEKQYLSDYGAPEDIFNGFRKIRDEIKNGSNENLNRNGVLPEKIILREIEFKDENNEEKNQGKYYQIYLFFFCAGVDYCAGPDCSFSFPRRIADIQVSFLK